MAFFHFSQNNSGGSFDLNEESGITHHVIIEAENSSKANQIMGELINDCWEGGDGGYCSCCGERWHEQYSGDDGTDEPMVYNLKPEDHEDFFMEKGKSVCIHYADGKKEWH